MEFKLLRQGDEHVLSACAAGVFDDPIDVDRTRELLADPRHHLAVAMDGDVVIGFVSAVHYVHPDKARPELWINEIGVAPTHQRRGVAKQLLHTLLSEASRIGCEQAWVLTERSNIAAIGLYKSVGGVEEREQPIMFTVDIDGRYER